MSKNTPKFEELRKYVTPEMNQEARDFLAGYPEPQPEKFWRQHTVTFMQYSTAELHEKTDERLRQLHTFLLPPPTIPMIVGYPADDAAAYEKACEERDYSGSDNG